MNAIPVKSETFHKLYSIRAETLITKQTSTMSWDELVLALLSLHQKYPQDFESSCKEVIEMSKIQKMQEKIKKGKYIKSTELEEKNPDDVLKE